MEFFQCFFKTVLRFNLNFPSLVLDIEQVFGIAVKNYESIVLNQNVTSNQPYTIV